MNQLAQALLRGRNIRADHHQMHNAVSRVGTHVSLATRVKQIARNVNDLGPVHIGPGLRDSIAEFQPEVIHSLLGTVREMRMALALSRVYDIPILPHFTDDWPRTIYGDGQFLGTARGVSARLLSRILDRSPVLLVIGSDMASEFESRYDAPTIVVGNSVDTPTRARSDTPRASLVYAGGLHLGRADIIAKFAEVLDNRGTNDGLAIDLYTGPNDLPLAESLAARYQSVRAQGFLPPDAVVSTLESSFAALFVESPEQRILDYTRLSVSTKVPEYLAARTPIIVVGPLGQASVRELVKTPQAIYAGDGSAVQPIADALQNLVAERATISARAEFPRLYGRAETNKRFTEAARTAVSEWSRR